MNLNQIGAVVCILTVGGLWTAGCMASPSEGDEESVGVAQSAFGEGTCGTNDADIDDADTTTSWGCFGSSPSFTSPYPYGHSDCTNGFIVTYVGHNSGTGEDTPIVWGDYSITTKADCENSRVRIDVYQKIGGTYSGHELGNCTLSGEWFSGLGTPFCDWNYSNVVSGTCAGQVHATSTSPVKVIAQAYDCSGTNCSTHTIRRVGQKLADTNGC